MVQVDETTQGVLNQISEGFEHSRRGGAARLGQADRGMSCGGRKRICDASASPSDRRSPVSADDCNPGGNFFLELV